MRVTIHAAKTTLSELIRKAEAGEEVVISRGDVPVVRLVPIGTKPPARQPGTMKGVVRVPRSFFDPLPPEEIDAWER